MTNDSDTPPFTSKLRSFSPSTNHPISSAASSSCLEGFTDLDMSPQPFTRKPFVMMDQQNQQSSHCVVTPCRSSSSDKGVDSVCTDEVWQNQDRHHHGGCASFLSPPPPPQRRHMMPASSNPESQHNHGLSSPLPFFPHLSDTVEDPHYHHHLQHPDFSSGPSPLPSFKLKQRSTAADNDSHLPFLR